MAMLSIDGDQGEGGGQILRSALSLSLYLQRPFRIVNIRARRRQPGLRPQHLMAVQAAAAIGDAEVEGANLGSMQLSFIPHGLLPGTYRFDIGTAGSTTLLLQAILLPLLSTGATSHLTLIGGTHNPLAPPFEFMQQVLIPLLQRMGAHINMHMERAGFFPSGGGILHVLIEPITKLRPLHLSARGRLLDRYAGCLLANLPEHIAERELNVLRDELKLEVRAMHTYHPTSQGQGNALFVGLHSEGLTELFCTIGKRGWHAESVAQSVVAEVKRYLNADVPVGRHLADQLLLPMALAGGGEFLTLTPDLHTPTNIAVIRQFLDIPIHCKQLGDDRWLIQLGGSGG